MGISSRRRFLKATSLSVAGAVLHGPVEGITAEEAAKTENRPITSQRLDGGWQFFKGPFDGVQQVWKSDQSSQWQEVTLPHCYNGMDACDPDRPYFRGQGWYRTRLAVRNPYAEGRTLLHFQGAGQTTTVWVGTQEVGEHKGGYDEFFLDITAAVAQLPQSMKAQGVPITVLCDNSPDRDRIPSEQSDFCLYGGLYRHVNLVYVPAVALELVHILPSVEENGQAKVSISARLYNPGGRQRQYHIDVEVIDPKGATIHRAARNMGVWQGFAQIDEFQISAPALWSPDSPNLYRCRVTLSGPSGANSQEERFGIRYLEFEEHGACKLNGTRVLLRGTQRHADHAAVAAAMNDDQVREEMKLIRDMGANFIRLAHYQQDRLVLELCDELGLLVWEELAWCRAGVGNAAFQQNATDMLTHMIEQHYNHPSILFWGLGNEDDWPNEYPDMDKEAIRVFMKRMHDTAHALDDSRMTAFRRCDFARDIPDVYSPSIWAGWYSGDFHDYQQNLEEQRYRVKRMIHVEWGADSHAGRHSENPDSVLGKVQKTDDTAERGFAYLMKGGEPRVSRDGDWSESYACDLFDWYLKTQEKLDWLSGSAHWIFKDFASPLRGDDCIPRVNQKGVVERDMTKKESYFLFQSYWTEKPMVHVYGHSWPIRWGKEGEARLVRVYSNCPEVQLFLNGVSQGARKRDSQDFPAAGLRWNVVFQSGRNHLCAVASKNGMNVSDAIEFIYQTEPWGAPTALRLSEATRLGTNVTAEARLFDANGVLCLDARNVVRFALGGSGNLIGDLGTTRASRELQLSNGRAQISLIPEGKCILTADVAGVASATLEVV